MRAADRGGHAIALRQRLRAGLLAHERLWLAAYLGSEPAAEAIGERPPAEPLGGGENSEGLERWLEAIHVAGDEAVALAALSAASAVVAHFESVFAGDPEQHLARACIQAAQDCLDCPCAIHRRITEATATAGNEVLCHVSSVLLLALNWRDTDAMGAMEGTAIGLPLEFVYLSSGLADRGIEHVFVDAWLYDRTIPELETEVRAAKIVVICSAPSYLFWRDGITNIELASRSVRQLKALNPDVLVALVGPHGTVDPQSFLDMGLDFLLRGEPDETFPELAARVLAGEPTDEIPGVVDARAGLAAETGCSVEVPDLGALPPTDLSRFRLGDYPFPPASGPPALLRGKIATLYEASRGCPYACIYCFKIGFRDKYRVKPAERIDRELAELAAAGVGYVYLIDEIFFLKRKWAIEILPLFAKHGIAWGCQTRASALLPEIAADGPCCPLWSSYPGTPSRAPVSEVRSRRWHVLSREAPAQAARDALSLPLEREDRHSRQRVETT